MSAVAAVSEVAVSPEIDLGPSTSKILKLVPVPLPRAVAEAYLRYMREGASGSVTVDFHEGRPSALRLAEHQRL